MKGLLPITFIVLLILKLTNLAKLNWIQVFIPLYIVLGVFIFMFISALIFGFFKK